MGWLQSEYLNIYLCLHVCTHPVNWYFLVASFPLFWDSKYSCPFLSVTRLLLSCALKWNYGFAINCPSNLSPFFPAASPYLLVQLLFTSLHTCSLTVNSWNHSGPSVTSSLSTLIYYSPTAYLLLEVTTAVAHPWILPSVLLSSFVRL